MHIRVDSCLLESSFLGLSLKRAGEFPEVVWLLLGLGRYFKSVLRF